MFMHALLLPTKIAHPIFEPHKSPILDGIGHIVFLFINSELSCQSY